MTNPRVNKRYGRVLQHLTVADDIVKPWAHTFPLRLPGCFFTSLASLEFCRLDWTQRRLLVYFCRYLRHFSSVTSLRLTQCRLCSARDLRGLINVFPKLTDVSIDSIVVSRQLSETPIAQQHQPTLSPERPGITGISTWSHSDDLNPFDHEHCVELQEEILNTLSSYSTVTEISFYPSQFRSFARLRHFLYAFPNLCSIDVEGDPEWEHLDEQANTSLPAKDLEDRPWKYLSLSFMCSETVHWLLDQCSTRSCRVHSLCIFLSGLPRPTLLQTVEKMLQGSGPELEEFRWEVDSSILSQVSQNDGAEVSVSLTL